ncbi:unnamed protein product, partial [Rotaria sordida]
SIIIDQPSYSLMENRSIQNNRQALTSIYKKPSSQLLYNPYSTKNVDLLEKPDLENYRSLVLFDILPPTTTTKPSQSILRSEKLFSKR